MSKRTVARGRKPRPLADRFWEKVDQSNGPDACWEWTAARNQYGYGQISRGRSFDGTHRNAGAHVIAWELANKRRVPPRLQMMHSCNNPPCCNPSHLSVGTSQDDADYRIVCGHTTRGETNPRAKLTEDKVIDIRSRYASGGISQRKLATEFNVHQMQISRVVTRKTWSHVK